MAEIAALVSIASVLVGAIVTVTAYLVTIKIEQKGMRGQINKLWEKSDEASSRQAENDLCVMGLSKDIQFIKETLVEIKDRLTEEGK